MDRGVDEQERQAKYKRWKDTTTEMLAGTNQESYFKARSVFEVADELRKWNEDAYEPEVISIGPRYTGRKKLLPMDEIKRRCVFHLFNRSLGYTISPQKYLNNCMDAILKIDAVVRTSYVSKIELDWYDLAAIMFNDGCFLLEFLISGSSIDSIIPPFRGRISAISPILELEIKMEVVKRDLILLENQIPFFVLDVLFQNIFDIEFHYLIHEIHNRAKSLFRFDEAKAKAKANFRFAHFLELASQNINKEWEGLQVGESHVISIIGEQVESQCLNSCFWNTCCAKIETKHTLNRCATKLEAFGVTINPLRSTLEFGMKFSYGKLEIPPVRVTREMRAKWLNLIAWEHHMKLIKPKGNNENQHWRVATSSALLFNDLIRYPSDVQLLKDRGVLIVDEDLKMNNRDLMAVFHSMKKGVDRGIIDPIYSSNFDALNKYSPANCFKRNFLKLLRYYFSRYREFLLHGYNFAATALTLLTIIQTFYAVFAYHRPPK